MMTYCMNNQGYNANSLATNNLVGLHACCIKIRKKKKKRKELCWQSIRGVLLTTSCASWALTYIPAGVVRTEAHYFTANEKIGVSPASGMRV